MTARSLTTLAALAALGLSPIAIAREAKSPLAVSIPFASTGGIDEWHADGDKSIFLRSRSKDWYKAELAAPCAGLEYATQIGYVSESDGSFDSSSAVLVDGQRCQLVKLEKSAAPPHKGK